MDNIPVGADTKNAPWNGKNKKAKSFVVDVTTTLHKKDYILSDDYEDVTDTEDEYTSIDSVLLSNVDVEQEWKEQRFDIPYLLQELEEFATLELLRLKDKNPNTQERRNHLASVIEACKGWQVEETIVEGQ